MTSVKITILRSKQWVNSQQLDRGENVPEFIIVDVAPRDLSIESRKVLLNAGWQGYATTFAGYFTSSLEWTSSPGYGRIDLVIDAEAPTVEQIDAVIVSAGEALAAKKKEREDAAAKAKSESDAWAALPLAERAKTNWSDMAQHRQYAPQAFAEVEEFRKQERRIAEGEQAIADRLVLSEFLANIPDDALRGTLKALASGEQAIAALRDKIEAAAVKFAIFSSDE